MVNGFDLMGQWVYLGDADRQLGVKLVSQPDAVGFDAQEEIFGAGHALQSCILHNLHLSQLGGGQITGDELVAAIEKNNFQASVAAALSKAFDFSAGRKEWGGNLLTYVEMHVFLVRFFCNRVIFFPIRICY